MRLMGYKKDIIREYTMAYHGETRGYNWDIVLCD